MNEEDIQEEKKRLREEIDKLEEQRMVENSLSQEQEKHQLCWMCLDQKIKWCCLN